MPTLSTPLSGSSAARQPSPTGSIRFLRVLLAASLIVPALLFAAAGWQDRRVLFDEAARRVEKTAEVLEQHATAAFHTYELVFARVDEHLRSAGGRETPEQLYRYLASIDHELREVGSLFLVDTTGHVTVHSRYFPTPAANVVDRDYFQALATVGAVEPSAAGALGETGLAVGAPIAGRFSGSPKLNIARAHLGPGGAFEGAIAISVSQEYFEAFHRTLSMSQEDSTVLLRADGAILARSPAVTADQIGAFTPEKSRSLLGRIGRGVAIAVSPFDGIERITSSRKLAGYPIYVGYGLNTGAVLKAWYENLILYGALALAAAATLFGVTWLALRKAREEALARTILVAEMGRREAAETALRQAQKMEAVGQLTGGIAHDFNNLLAAVLGNLELLAKRLPDDPRLRRYVQGATEGAQRGAALTQRMLAFSRRQELKPDVVDIPALVHGIADLLTRSIGPTVEIETRFPVQLPPAHVDANQLETALLNLAVNARDAMPKGGQIVIAGREEPIGTGSALGLVPGRYVVLSVADTGEGMDEAVLARAMEPFFTTKEVGRGTGLGLAMVHGLAAQSGGTLRIESAPGRGTNVELWLPVGQRSGVAASPPAPIPAPVPSRPMRIMVVDDDALVLRGTVAMLDDLGHDPVEAASGRQALDILGGGGAFDLVLTDQVMPGMTGMELAAEIQRLDPTLPIVLASGFADLAAEDQARLPRLNKPYMQAALARAIADAAPPGGRAGNIVPIRQRRDAAAAHSAHQR